jgi:hypothetical protein
MNKIVEAFQYATDRYWGNEDGYKFRVRLESFDTQQEVGDGTERIIRTTFTMVANAYLLPETFDNAPLTKKGLTTKKVVFGVETGVSGELFSNPLLYNEYAQVIDFIAVRGSQLATFVNSNTAKLTNVKLPKLPVELRGSFDITNWFQVYINSVFIPSSVYTYEFNGETREIIFSFPGLTFPLDNNDEISITGKFIQL